MKTTKLTRADLETVLRDDRHEGFGYATRRSLTWDQQQRLDRAVITAANRLAMDREALFTWANSKDGRWLVDEASGQSGVRVGSGEWEGRGMRVYLRLVLKVNRRSPSSSRSTCRAGKRPRRDARSARAL